MVTHCSKNAVDFFGQPITTLVGADFTTLFDSHSRHEINNFLGRSMSLHRGVSVGNIMKKEGLYRIFLRRLEIQFIIELERVHQSERNPEGLLQEVQTLLFMVSETDELTNKIYLMLEGIRRICGVDRVVFMTVEGNKIVLKDSVQGPFLQTLRQEDLSDAVISDEKSKRLQNLRVDFVNDFENKKVKFLSDGTNSKVPDISLTLGQGRSFLSSKLLKSQNVRASATWALIAKTRLWGVVECHHSDALYLSPMKRQIVSLFMENFGFQLELRGLAK